MRNMLVLVVVLGILLIAGTGAVFTTILHRAGRAAGPRIVGAVLDEPAGTHIVAAAGFGDGIAVTLQGGGPDRVVIVNPATGQATDAAKLAR